MLLGILITMDGSRSQEDHDSLPLFSMHGIPVFFVLFCVYFRASQPCSIDFSLLCFLYTKYTFLVSYPQCVQSNPDLGTSSSVTVRLRGSVEMPYIPIARHIIHETGGERAELQLCPFPQKMMPSSPPWIVILLFCCRNPSKRRFMQRSEVEFRS